VPLVRTLGVLTRESARVLGSALGTLQASVGRLVVGGVADVCIVDPQAHWTVEPAALRSQGKHTPFAGYELPGRVRQTLVGGQVAFDAAGRAG
jgi:dihydroorotase